MSLPRKTALMLMAFADGELDGAEREDAEKILAGSEEARRLVETMQSTDLSGWLDEIVEGQSQAADGIADAVMAKIDSGATNVVRFDAAARRRKNSQAVFGVGIAVLALAASVWLFVGGASSTTAQSAGSVAAAAMPVAPAAESITAPEGTSSWMTAAAAEAANAGLGVEVNEIDSPTHEVTVFEIPANIAAAAGQAAPSSVVIMISDEPAAP